MTDENDRSTADGSEALWEADVSGDEPPVLPDLELMRKLGEGGFGQVWLGRNRLDGRYVAVKLSTRLAELDGTRQYRQRVAEHPNFIPIEHVGRSGAWIYCVMPLADDAGTAGPVVDPEVYRARTLQSELRRRGRLPTDEVLRVGTAIGSALEHLHARGGRHGDIKPDNVLSRLGRWQVGDHGLVSDVDGAVPRSGTIPFLPPEGGSGPRDDLYALGKTLYLLATGRAHEDFSLFLAGDFGIEEAATAARRLEEIIRRTCALEPDDRYRSAADLRAGLESAAAPTARSRRLVFGAAVVLLAIVTSATIVLWPESETRFALAFGDITKSRVHYRKSEDDQWEKWDGGSFEPDDMLKFELELEGKSYGYLIVIEPDGALKGVLDRSSGAPVDEIKTGDNSAFQVDRVGYHVIVAIASNEPLDELDSWLGGFMSIGTPGEQPDDPRSFACKQDGEGWIVEEWSGDRGSVVSMTPDWIEPFLREFRIQGAELAALVLPVEDPL